MLKGAQRLILAGMAGAAVCLTNASAAAQAGAIGTGGIKGFVHDSGGLGIVGVEVTIAGSANRYETDESGKFELAKISPGSLSLRFRRLGFRPDTIELTIMAGQTVPLDLRINRVAIAIAPMIVYGRGTLTGWRAGFYSRRDRGNGHFYTREEIEKRNPAMTTDLFRTIPGARVMNGPGGFQRFIRFRGNRAGCAPLTWLDGSPLGAGEFDLDAISPRSIEAMEIYAGPATVPSQFVSVRGVASACGVIVIWTREPPPAVRRRKSNVSAATEIAKLVEAKKVFTSTEVDAPAHQDVARIFRPTYPDALFDAGVRGSVMAEFVVDANGQVNMETFSPVFSTHPDFTLAVQAALREAVYIPAVKQGYPVMQVVQHEFKFVPDSSRRVAKP
jgi:hypothetical protein